MKSTKSLENQIFWGGIGTGKSVDINTIVNICKVLEPTEFIS